MCTAISFQGTDHYFGRNLDLEYSNNEIVIITPRNFPFFFRKETEMLNHYAMIGIGIINQNYPLYYDATNEYGLSMAGLNFPHCAEYHSCIKDQYNIAPFEIIPWLLGQCKSIQEALILLKNTNIAKIAFSKQLPLSPLHWLLSDQTKSIVLESMDDGLQIIDNPIGVLTNSPDFRYHFQNLSNYMHLSNHDPKNQLYPDVNMIPYSRGMGGLGLPGDLSSASRFIRAAFIKSKAIHSNHELSEISQFFHVLQSVSQTEGSVKVNDKYEKTVYSSCCNTTKGIYYYKTYYNPQITAVNLFHENLNSCGLIQYKMRWHNNVLFEN